MTGIYQIRDGILEAYTGRETVALVPKGVHTIGENAFKGCVSLQKVVLPSGLHRIESGAFKGCRKLEEVRIPEGVCGLGNYAFHRCHALKQIVLPETVEELGDCVFLYCDSLTEVRMPGVKRLGRQVFVNDVLLKELQISPNLCEEDLCDVFTGCGKIQRITFPDGKVCQFANAVEAAEGGKELPSLVRAVAVDVLRMMELDGRCLVRFLTNLKHVEIPEGIESLAKSCFFDKRGILSVTFPRSLREIGNRAFRNCINLERVIFRGEDPKIHSDTFKSCSSLKYIHTWEGSVYELSGPGMIKEKGIPSLVSAIHRQVLGNFRISGTMLLKYLGSESRVVVPEGITVIAEEAFAGNEAVDRVILPESVRRIGAEAFRDCVLLQTIVLPESLSQMGARAFENCVKLIRIQIPSAVSRIKERTFRRCRVLREVKLPEGLQEIGESAFYECAAIGKIEFPSGLTAIGQMAFYRCGSLKEVSLPPETEYVGNLAFAQSGVRKAWISGSGRNYGTDLFGGCNRLKSLVVKEGVHHIPDKLAYGCTALRHVSLPSTLQSAGRHAWEETPFLAVWREEERNEPEDGIFWDGRDLAGEVRLPDQIRILAGGAFYGNEDVTAVYLPEHLRWLGPAAFKGCRRLRTAFVPSGIKTLEAEVFSGCGELKSVLLSEAAEMVREGVMEDRYEERLSDSCHPAWEIVGERTFYRCQKIRKIRLERAEEIGKEAFAGCLSLMKGIINRINKIGERAFEDTAFMKTGEGMPVVIGTVAVCGSACVGTVQLPEGVTGIAPYAFAGNRQIARILLPESLLWIGEGAFFGCSRVTEVEFSKGLQKVGACAFERCISLQKAEVLAPQVGASAFAGCRALEQAILPRVSILGRRLFAGCAELTECICGRARAVQPYCFSGCRKLKKLDTGSFCVIRTFAFDGCDSLRRVELQDGVCLGEHAFEDCGNLEEVILTGEQGRVDLSEYAFSGCTRLRSVTYQGTEWIFHGYGDILLEGIPETVRFLLHSAYSCFEVEQEEELYSYRGAGRKVKIPEGIKRIREDVFRDHPMLQEVEIPKSVEYIGARAFHGTAWLEQRRKESPMVTVNHMLLDGSCCRGEVTVPEDIRLICGWAFANGMEIKKICFLSDRVQVEEYAFRNCIFLEEMILPDGTVVKFAGIEDRYRELPALARQAALDGMNCFKTDADGVLLECTGNISRLRLARGITAIEEGAFQDGNLLTEAMLPETVKSIGKGAFMGCKWLEVVYGATGVEQIEERAFSGCGKLRRIELSESLNRISARAFEHCTSLEEILLPEGIEEIPPGAFYRCHSLRRVNLPSTLKKIGREAFAFCRQLSEIRIPESTLVEERAFAGCALDILPVIRGLSVSDAEL